MFPSPSPSPATPPLLCYPRREEPTSQSNRSGKRQKNGEMTSAVAGKEMGRASYIRIKHEEERRDASWKEPEGRVFSATTRTDVAARLGELRDQILAGRASFADLATQHSGCSSTRRRGDLVRMVEPIDVQKVA